MNLFIWNDYEWKLIEKSDEYDKNKFFIVRKLFVQWPIKVSVFERQFCSKITYYILNSIRFLQNIKFNSVRFLQTAGTSVCYKLVREYFEIYGVVELVETIFHGDMNGASAIIVSDYYEAYVTFAQCEDAYNAFMANRYNTNGVKVLPADTWRQPGNKLKQSIVLFFFLFNEKF